MENRSSSRMRREEASRPVLLVECRENFYVCESVNPEMCEIEE